MSNEQIADQQSLSLFSGIHLILQLNTSVTKLNSLLSIRMRQVCTRICHSYTDCSHSSQGELFSPWRILLWLEGISEAGYTWNHSVNSLFMSDYTHHQWQSIANVAEEAACNEIVKSLMIWSESSSDILFLRSLCLSILLWTNLARYVQMRQILMQRR